VKYGDIWYRCQIPAQSIHFPTPKQNAVTHVGPTYMSKTFQNLYKSKADC